ncbi:hypothetical protein LCGC14_2567910 [marine sediment metagenome]|uniref:Glucose/Sorbosone dehydrogenase domain-containing protein n=1 Tax=marine sediment metagenome TaxID=412755 RepID=A0A0F9DB12_9ZZZZ
MNNCIKLPEGVSRRDGMKYIPFGDSDPERIIVSMIEFQGRIYVATQRGIYTIDDDKLVRLEFEEDNS